MKKKLMAAAALLLLLGIAGRTTSAYHITYHTAKNVVTSASIRVELQEWADREMTVPFKAPEAGVPVAAVTRVVTVKNTGANPAWVRMQVQRAFTLSEENAAYAESAEQELELVALDMNTVDWQEKDGWYYYCTPLEAGATAEPLFTTVSFSGNMSDFWQESRIEVNVSLQAVQTANNGAAVLEAAGWPEG